MAAEEKKPSSGSSDTDLEWCVTSLRLVTEVISYCAGIAVLGFKNDHSGVTCEADFPIGDVRSDGQRQVEWSSEPRTV